jgi:glycosyltransferase involved in cell wall biosynthesis
MVSISIAMATYNGAPYILQQLASLANQTYRPAELVITDDCSTDGTLELAGHFARNAPFPVRIYGNETRLGYRANFLHAATLCTSELIAFCDQDDIWKQRKIETCIKCFDNPDVLLAYHNAIVVTPDEQPIESLDKYAAPRSVNPPLSTSPWVYGYGFTQVFRRSIPMLSDLWSTSLDQNNLAERMAHDQWFFFLSSVLGSIAYVNEPLAFYRQHGSNLFGWRGRTSFNDRMRHFFTNVSDIYARFEVCSRQRSNILDKAKDEWNASWHDRALAAVTFYRRLERQYAARSIVYNAAETSCRLKAFREILSSGGYELNDSFTFGPKSFAKDAVVGVLMGHLLKGKADE